MLDAQYRPLPQVGLMDIAAVALRRISSSFVLQSLKTDTSLVNFGWSEFAKNGYSTSSLIAFVLFTVFTVGLFWVSVAIYAAARKNNGDTPIGALLSSTCDPIDSGAVAAKPPRRASKGAHVSDAANDSAVGGKSTAAAAAKVLTAATNPTASAA
ncbi:MAG: hypothetical protein LBI39_03815, partial [Puniceicoccales bacterium]|nr:hypothetical protein [Puniceicoccales bacterium]